MKERINVEYISDVVKKALINDKIATNDTSVIIYDIDFLIDRIEFLKSIFPEGTNHAIAVKANPLIKILNIFQKLGVGLETASFPELQIAQKVGVNNNKIVFDSPSKTNDEIMYALENGIHINADSFGEIERIANALKLNETKSIIGIRINPQVGSGTIKSTSVADKISKFGIPLNEHRSKIIEVYKENKWLNGIHLHIGSQGISTNQLINGLKKVYLLSEEINFELKTQNRKITQFDIGGGFPISYRISDRIPDINEYIKRAKKACPNLFENYKITTEFGRYINANSAFAISRVEYVKEEQDYKILSIHLGADFLLRKAYNPKDWHHEITLLDSKGNIKTSLDEKKYIVAGPLCFAGDIIAKDITLPIVAEGDFIVIHDVGAYTLSMWSRYNSRQIPKVIGYSQNKNDFEILKQRENLDDLYNFWK